MLCSIVIPVFNRYEVIRASLNSVIGQSDGRWECIVVDDGSSDGTQQVVEEYVNRDARFSLVQRNREPKGAPTCRNLGLGVAKGHLVIFLDSDDELSPTRVQESVNFFCLNPQCDALVFSVERLGAVPSELPLRDPRDFSDDLMDFIRGKLPWLTSCPTWRRGFLCELKGWKEGMPKAQDWELHVRALLMRPAVRKTASVGYFYCTAHHNDRIGNAVEDLELHKGILDVIPGLMALCRESGVGASYERAVFFHCFLYRLRKVAMVGGTYEAFAFLSGHRGSPDLRSYRYFLSAFVILNTGVYMLMARSVRWMAKVALVRE